MAMAGRQVAHVWAHQSKEEGQGYGHMSFWGHNLYSYSTIIGRLIQNKRKQQAALVSIRSYSVTTSKHQSWMRAAVSHMTVFHVWCVDPMQTPRKYMDEYKQRLMDLVGKWDRATRHKPYLLEEITELVAEANEFAAFHGLKTRLGDPKKLKLDAMIEMSRKVAEQNRERERKDAKRREAAQAKEEADNEIKRQKWLAGEGNYYPYKHDESTRLRIVGDKLETSKGAEVPLQHAIKAFKFVKACHDKGKTYERNGKTIHVGHFAIDKIDEAGNVKAGCHVIEWEEVLRVAKLAGIAA